LKKEGSKYKTRKNYMFGLKLAQVLVENFIFIILKSFILKNKKENCWKTMKKRKIR